MSDEGELPAMTERIGGLFGFHVGYSASRSFVVRQYPFSDEEAF